MIASPTEPSGTIEGNGGTPSEDIIESIDRRCTRNRIHLRKVAENSMMQQFGDRVVVVTGGGAKNGGVGARGGDAVGGY